MVDGEGGVPWSRAEARKALQRAELKLLLILKVMQSLLIFYTLGPHLLHPRLTLRQAEGEERRGRIPYPS